MQGLVCLAVQVVWSRRGLVQVLVVWKCLHLLANLQCPVWWNLHKVSIFRDQSHLKEVFGLCFVLEEI